jgi:hypothetical protein
MIAIKISCQCGQRYAFDAEPVNGHLTSAVACPVCGIDGTETANAFLAQNPPAPPAAAAAPARMVRLRTAASADVAPPAAQATVVATSAPPAPDPVAAPRRPSRLPGQLDPEQAQHEARAKILWGDAVDDVIRFLMLHGFQPAEATSLVQELFKERAVTIRRNGMKKAVLGFVLMCVPVVAALAFLSMGFFPVKIFAFTVIVGLYGAYLLIKGTIMFLAPKSEPGDVSAQ